ncbi:MAG: hypothetical protein ACTHNP_03580 [Solirubrobacterales bacterium]
MITAVYGAPSRSIDVTEQVQELFDKGGEQITVNPEELGIDPAPGHLKNFGVVYQVGGQIRTAAGGENDRVSLPRPPGSRAIIVGAVYGSLNGSESVTRKVQEMIDSGKDTIEASNENFGDPSHGTLKHLTVSWRLEDKGEIHAAACTEGQSVRVA